MQRCKGLSILQDGQIRWLTIVLLVAMLAVAVLPGCAAPAPEAIKETVEVPVEVTKIVEVPAEAAPSEVQEWELVNPEGVVLVEPVELAPRLTTLEGKTVMLYWNKKPNGDEFLSRVAELLTEQVKNIKIIKNWEAAPETVDFEPGPEGPSVTGKKRAEKLAAFKPDLVIGSNCD